MRYLIFSTILTFTACSSEPPPDPEPIGSVDEAATEPCPCSEPHIAVCHVTDPLAPHFDRHLPCCASMGVPPDGTLPGYVIYWNGGSDSCVSDEGSSATVPCAAGDPCELWDAIHQTHNYGECD